MFKKKKVYRCIYYLNYYIVIIDTRWKNLKKQVKLSQQAAFAKGTLNNLKTQWESYPIFCKFFHIEAMPASLENICNYIIFLKQSSVTVQTIRNYLNGVKLLHLYSGYTFELLTTFEVKILLKGLARMHPHQPKQALPITPEVLLDIFPHLDLNNHFHIALWSSFSFFTGFFLFARKSNLVPPSTTTFDPNKHLSRGDILSSDTGLVVQIRWSKTIQCGERTLILPITSIPGSKLCPVSAWTKHTAINNAGPKAPAFSYHTNNGLTTLTYNIFTRSLRKPISLTGRNPSFYSGHSFRRGGATWAFKNNVPGELIKLQGDWASDAYLKYLDFSFESKLFVSFAMKEGIRMIE